jgi:hypothetical protein
MNKWQTAGVFQSNWETLLMAVNCEFFPRMPADGRWEFTREWVTNLRNGLDMI